MIKKELDSFVAEDKYAAAGRKAEEQMAFYLKRFFSSNPHVFVLNGIRLERDGDAAQMDHLVLHRYGVIVVESKSVAGKVQIKDDGQWIRWYGRESTGMASPVTQAKLQLRFMRDYLDMATKPKGVFERYAFDVQVAISDSGVILWPTTGGLSEVCKADQVAERIENRIVELEKSSNAPTPLSADHLSKIADFLCASHRPLQLRVAEISLEKYEAVVEKQSAENQLDQDFHLKIAVGAVDQETESDRLDIDKRLVGGACKHCSSGNVSILFGRNYYFHCNACNKSTPLKSVCTSCGGVEIPHKKGKEFFLECKSCNTNRLFHVND